MDRETYDLTPNLPPSSPAAESRVGLPSPIFLVLGALLCVAAVAAVAWWLNNGPLVTDAQNPLLQQQPPLFVNWARPDVALLLSGEAHGYLQPCGCSHPQKGGLARRYAFLQTLKKKGWPVVAADLGDLPKRGSPQSMLKYETAMKALHLMDYTAVTFGEQEMNMVLVYVLAQYALNNPAPRVVGTNLKDRGPKEMYDDMVVGWEVGGGQGKTPRVGVVALVGPSVEKAVAKLAGVKFDGDTPKLLRQNLAELHKKQVELVVLLYQGSTKEAGLAATFCAEERARNPKFPRVDVILCLSVADEPSGVAQQVGDSMIVSVGHKGRYVGVVGAYRTGKVAQPWELRYQLVPIGPEYEAPEGKEESNPVIKLMQDYADEVKNGGYLAKYPRQKHPMQLQFKGAEYVGSESCKSCHAAAFKIWKDSPHPHAFDTLVKAKRPNNRQFDGECIVCHTVGFAYETGYDSFEAKKNRVKLTGVSCESCHGPCSEHVADTKDLRVRALINPYKATPGGNAATEKFRLGRIDQSCQKCHDIDNDVHWNFEKNWPRIVHSTPRPK